MKIEIEVSDFYLDEDQDIATGLKNSIKNEVVQTIKKAIQERVDNQVTKEITATIEKILYNQITEAIEGAMQNGKIKSKKTSLFVTFEEYTRECLESGNYGWQSFDEVVKKLATSFADDLKKRYDLLFASQIITKLNENGLLKEDVFKLITSPNKQKQ